MWVWQKQSAGTSLFTLSVDRLNFHFISCTICICIKRTGQLGRRRNVRNVMWPGLHKLWSAGKRLMRTKRIYEDREIWKEYALLSRNGICREYALFGIVLTQIWLRQMRFDSDFTQTSGQKNGDWSLWSSVAVRLSSVLSPKSSVLGPHSSVLGPQSSITIFMYWCIFVLLSAARL